MAAALPVAALAMSAFGTIQQGASERNQQYRQAAQDDENGRLTLKSGEEDAFNVLRQGFAETDEAAATMAGSGLAWGGSIATVLQASAEKVEMDIDRVRERARAEAANHYAQGRERRKAGKQALLGSMFSALSSTIGGISDMRNQRRIETAGAAERTARAGGG